MRLKQEPYDHIIFKEASSVPDAGISDLYWWMIETEVRQFNRHGVLKSEVLWWSRRSSSGSSLTSRQAMSKLAMPGYKNVSTPVLVEAGLLLTSFVLVIHIYFILSS